MGLLSSKHILQKKKEDKRCRKTLDQHSTDSVLFIFSTWFIQRSYKTCKKRPKFPWGQKFKAFTVSISVSLTKKRRANTHNRFADSKPQLISGSSIVIYLGWEPWGVRFVGFSEIGSQELFNVTNFICLVTRQLFPVVASLVYGGNASDYNKAI
jgi:hypothetical protein